MTASDVGSNTRVVAGRYRLGERLGRGGMAVVWAGYDELLARPVAIKEVRLPEAIEDTERSVLHERAMREARAAARLDHPCAVRVYDVCDEGDIAFIVMELIDGQTLADVVRCDGPMLPARVAEIGVCLVEALQAAHEAGIIHRDVKPGNVIVRADGRVTLTDFGIASTAGDPSITSTGLLLGSPAYISPERARGDAPGPASDLWSLGATLYTAVEGRPPFDHPDPLATLTAVVTDQPRPCQRAGPVLCDVLTRLLDKDPARRPDAATLREALRTVAADPDAQRAPSVAVAPRAVRIGADTVALSTVPDPPLRTRALALVLLCTVVFLAAATAAALLTRT